jgi:alkanesulfonate monooxygenase
MAAAYAAEYNTSFVPDRAMKEVHDRVRKACEDADRDPATMTFSVGQVVCCGRTDAEISRRATAIGRHVDELRENGLAGTPNEVLEKLGRFAASGADRYYLQMLDLTDLDHLRLIAQEVLPHAPGR